MEHETGVKTALHSLILLEDFKAILGIPFLLFSSLKKVSAAATT
jgi:hypothetical protein